MTTTTLTETERAALTQLFAEATGADDEEKAMIVLRARGDLADTSELREIALASIALAKDEGGHTSHWNDARLILGLIDLGADLRQGEDGTIYASGDGYEIEIDAFPGGLESARRVAAMTQDDARAECARMIARS